MPIGKSLTTSRQDGLMLSARMNLFLLMRRGQGCRDSMKTIGGERRRRLLPFREGVDEFREDARLLREVGEFRHRLHLQFSSDRGAMQLHGPLVDA